MSRVLSRSWAAPVLTASAAALFILPLVTHLGSFPFAPGAAYSDVLVAHLSSANFLHRAVLTWGEIPLWNPTIVGGMPFAADPLSGLWYPPLWLLAIAPSAPVVNLFFWAHLALGAWGLFLLLRAESLGAIPAIAGAFAFAGMPKLVGHVGLGHMSLVAAVCLSPWVMLAAGRAVERIGTPGYLRAFLVAGGITGVVFLADPRWFGPVSLAGAGYAVWRWAVRVDRPRSAGRAWLAGIAAAVLALVAVAAALAIPLGEFTRLTTRGQISTAAADQFALPVERLIGLLIPSPGAWAEWLVSMGSVAFILAFAGAAASPRRGVFWIALTVVALVLSLGQSTPLGQWIASLPVAGLARVPARWLFFAGMGIAALAGYGLSSIQGEPDSQAARRVRLAVLAAAALIIAVTVALGSASVPVLWAPVLLALVTAACVWLGLRDRRFGWTAPVLAGLLVLELALFDFTLVEARPAEEALAPGRAVAAALATNDGTRVFSPSYAVPQEAAAEAGLELADGVHPLQLSSYVAYMADAAGFDAEPYSVTLPPFPSGDPSDNWNPTLDAEALGFLSIARVASSFPVEAEGLSLEEDLDGVLIYRNESVRPRSWIDDESGAGPAGPPDLVQMTANRVEITASGPGRLVLNDPVYPGWRAEVDGEAVTIEPLHGLLRSVDLPAGDHTVVFSFIPTSLAAGMALSLLCAAAAVLVWRRA